jgi:hypothetical protein
MQGAITILTPELKWPQSTAPPLTATQSQLRKAPRSRCHPSSDHAPSSVDSIKPSSCGCFPVSKSAIEKGDDRPPWHIASPPLGNGTVLGAGDRYGSRRATYCTCGRAPTPLTGTSAAQGACDWRSGRDSNHARSGRGRLSRRLSRRPRARFLAPLQHIQVVQFCSRGETYHLIVPSVFLSTRRR